MHVNVKFIFNNALFCNMYRLFIEMSRTCYFPFLLIFMLVLVLYCIVSGKCGRRFNNSEYNLYMAYPHIEAKWRIKCNIEIQRVL